MTQRFSILLGLILTDHSGSSRERFLRDAVEFHVRGLGFRPRFDDSSSDLTQELAGSLCSVCNRDELLNQHICNANVILYFSYSRLIPTLSTTITGLSIFMRRYKSTLRIRRLSITRLNPTLR